MSAPTFTIEVDGKQFTGREGQTILEICRDNGIDVPTLCYEPKLPGFGACRMCVVEVEGEEHAADLAARARPSRTWSSRPRRTRLREIRKTNLELIFTDHNAYCLPPCQNKCPSHIDIPGFLKANTEGNFIESARIFKRTIPFPSVLGRVCPAPCEEHCRRDEVEEAIAIRDSHRYAGDQVLKAAGRDGRQGARAVRGPAHDRQARRGHRLGPGGHVRGLLPAHRRPRRDRLRDATRHRAECSATASRSTACPRSRCSRPSTTRSPSWAARSCANMELGKDYTLDDLQNQGFDAVCVAIGCYETNKLGVPGEDADGVLDGLEYLRIATLGLPYPGHEGKRVVVIGGGFTSMDCTRTSVRQGAAEVTLVYRRDMKDMPAANEVHEAIEEGARAIFQAAPTRVVTDENNKVTGVEFQRMRHGRAGRVRPAPAGAGGRHRVRHRLRPRAAGDRPGPAARLAGPRLGRRRAPPRTADSRPTR